MTFSFSYLFGSMAGGAGAGVGKALCPVARKGGVEMGQGDVERGGWPHSHGTG